MKSKSFTIKVPHVKARGHMPPPSIRHKDRAKDYSRRDFKDPNRWS